MTPSIIFYQGRHNVYKTDFFRVNLLLVMSDIFS